jgi:Putative adhesin
VAVSTPKLVVLVFVALAALCGVAFAGSELLRHVSDRTTMLSQDVDRVLVHADAGDVHLVAGRADRVRITEHRTWWWDPPTVRTSIHDGILEVRIDGGAGDIRIDGLAGHIDLRTSAGNVSGRDLHPVAVQARTDGGDVDLQFGTRPVSVAGFSHAGDISIAVPGGEYRVDTTTRAGNIDVQGVLRNDRALRSISAHTDAGDVAVHGTG